MFVYVFILSNTVIISVRVQFYYWKVLKMPTKKKKCQPWLKKFQFENGYKPHNKGKTLARVGKKVYVRVGESPHNSAKQPDNDELYHGPCDNNVDVPYQLLRPKADRGIVESQMEPQVDRPDMATYKIVQLTKIEDLFNTAIRKHSDKKCKGKLVFDESREIQWGAVWVESLKCDTCNFKSESCKLYEEEDSKYIKRGRKAAKPNIGLILGLQTTSIAYRPICDIFACMNISPPSVNSMNELADRISKEVVEMNEENMSNIRKEIKMTKEVAGDIDPGCIRVEGDGRFNNRFGDTPFQPATQAVYTVLENESPKKRVIAISTANKLCKRGQLARLKDKSIACPNHPGSCTANIQEDAVIGDEEKYARECARKINEDGLTIKYFTADGDSKAFNGIKSAQNGKVEYLRDIRHMGISLKRAIANKPFSPRMFPGNPASQKQSIKRRFASDVKARCVTELKNVLQYHKGDIKKVLPALPDVRKAIAMCYRGYCGHFCKKHSYACKGLPHDKWLKNYLPRGCAIKMNASDESLLEDCLRVFLAPGVVEKMRFLTNTQAVESFNRTLNRVNPKDVTHSRGFVGRVHTAALMKNHGFAGCTILRTLRLGAKLTPGSRVIRYLQKREKDDLYHRQRKQSVLYKQQRSALRFRKYRLHENKNFQEFYCKDLADKPNPDHNYSR